MKICPKCGTQFTDTSLSFCLQDGTKLVDGADNRTDVMSAAEISAAETIDVTRGKSDPVSRQGVADTDNSNEPDHSQETVVRPAQRVSGTGFGFLTGFLAALVILGAVGLMVAGIWFLPGLFSLGPAVNSQSNSNVKSAVEIDRDQVLSVTASSIRKEQGGNLYIPQNAADNDVRTAWCEGAPGTGVGEWIKIEFAKETKLRELKIKPGYFKNASAWQKNNRVASVELLFSNGQTRVFDFPDEMKSQTVPLNGVETRFVKITLRAVHNGSADQKDTLISEIAFTGSK